METQIYTTPDKVTPLRRKPKSYQIDEHVMNDIRLRLYYYDAKFIAEKTGLSLAAIYHTRSGRTKWPRSHTFFALIKFLDLEMHLYDVKAHRYL